MRRLLEALGTLYTFLLAAQRGMILAVLLDGWRPLAYAVGWEITFLDGERGAHLDRVWVAPAQRGSWRTLKRLLREWDRTCLSRSLRLMITPVEKTRPSVSDAGTRIAGYRYYTEDRRYRWYFRDMQAASSRR